MIPENLSEEEAQAYFDNLQKEENATRDAILKLLEGFEYSRIRNILIRLDDSLKSWQDNTIFHQ